MLYSKKTATSPLTRTWVKVTDASGRTRMEARWTSAHAAVARPLAA